MSFALLLMCAPAWSAQWVVGQQVATVQEAVDSAAPGDEVLLPEGRWLGPVVVDKAITLRSAGGVLDGQDQGTVLTLAAPGVVVDGLNVHASGTDRAGPDSCIRVEPKAQGAQILNSELTRCTFGVWVHETTGVTIAGNHILGREDIGRRASRGNGVQLFDATDARVTDNFIEHARDGVYVSATEESFITGNRLEHLRYGIHYMFSWNNTVSDNQARFNTSGIALMSSHHLFIERNVTSDNERHGILFRDIQYTRIADNVSERNAEGLFFFSSLDNELVNNTIAHNLMGARVWAGTERNVVTGNAFIGNQQQVYYVSSHDQEWGAPDAGNYWSDYLGWDQDNDGYGDRPHRLDSFRSTLLHRFPVAALLLNSPALELLARLQEQLPALRTPAIYETHPAVVPPKGAS